MLTADEGLRRRKGAEPDTVVASPENEASSREPSRPKGVPDTAVLYTAGVPFVIKDKRSFGLPDHTIWHIFVLGGSLSHFFCIYSYLLTFPYHDDEAFG